MMIVGVTMIGDHNAIHAMVDRQLGILKRKGKL